MPAYHRIYLGRIVENQGNLFSRLDRYYPGIDTDFFIRSYMTSDLRARIDYSDPYPTNMVAKKLWLYFIGDYGFIPRKGKTFIDYVARWIGHSYSYYQWQYEMLSRELVNWITPPH